MARVFLQGCSYGTMFGAFVGVLARTNEYAIVAAILALTFAVLALPHPAKVS